jgi:hypothetical protein
LLKEAGSSAVDAAGVQVDDLWFVEHAGCPACRNRHEIGRFIELGAQVGTCGCGQTLFAQRSNSHRPAPGEVLERLLDKPLGELATASMRSVRIALPDATYFFADSPAGKPIVESTVAGEVA